MKIFPSYKASIIYGLLGIPFFVIGLDYIQNRYDNDLLVFSWVIFIFFIPTFFATADIKEIIQKFKIFNQNFENLFSKKEVLSFIPTWKRVLTVFCSFIISILISKIFNIPWI